MGRYKGQRASRCTHNGHGGCEMRFWGCRYYPYGSGGSLVVGRALKTMKLDPNRLIIRRWWALGIGL